MGIAKSIVSIVESPTHPKLSELFRSLGIEEIKLNSMRKAISQIKTQAPDYIIAEFFYGYGNNYAGANISNLDVMLHSLQRYAPSAKVIVIVDKHEKKYIDKLQELFSIYAVVQHPAATKVEQLLTSGL